MKKNLILVAAAVMMLVSCGTMGLGTGTQNGQSTQSSQASEIGGMLGSILNSVIGGSMSQKNLIGTWSYSQPGCAFTSDQLLAQAGGEVVAAEIKTKIQPTFQKVGIKASNTNVTFKEDGTFAAKFAGKSWSGKYTFDESTSMVTMQGLLLNINCYAKRQANGIALLFESSKLLTLLQTVSALSGNTSLQTIGDLSKNYNGLRLGFEFK